MAQVVSKFKAFFDATHFNEEDDTGGYGASRLEQFAWGEVTWEPIPQAPFLPASRIRVMATVRHKPLWVSAVAGSDENWRTTMQPWLDSQLPELQATIERMNAMRTHAGRIPVKFGTVEVEITPYVLAFPCRPTLNLAEKAPLVAAFRDRINGSGPLAETRQRIKRAEIPWLKPEEILAAYEAQIVAETVPEDAEEVAATADGVCNPAGDAAVEDGAAPEEAMTEPAPVEEPAPLADPGTEVSLAEEAGDGAIAVEGNGVGETGESGAADGGGTADTEAPDGDAPADEPVPEPLDYTLWKITFIDGSSRIYDSAADAWFEHDCADDPVRTPDEAATQAALDRIHREAEAAKPPLAYADIMLHERAASSPEPALAAARRRFERIAPKRARLEELLLETGGVAVAVSGGVNSCILALEARRVLGEERTRFLFAGNAPFVSGKRMDHMRDFEERFGIQVEHIPHPCATDPEVRKNTYLVCYNCRYDIFSALQARARAAGIDVIAQGFPATDEPDAGAGATLSQTFHANEQRAMDKGARAARELKVRSLLAEAGLTAEDMHAWALVLGLPQADDPDGSCMVSRFLINVPFTDEQLAKLESLEGLLHDVLHLRGVRLRPEKDGIVSITVDNAEMHSLMGIAPNVSISYRDLTMLGNQWHLTDELAKKLDDLIAKEQAEREVAVEEDDAHGGHEPDAGEKPVQDADAKPAGDDLGTEDLPASESPDTLPQDEYVCTHYYLGDVLRTVFDELRGAGFKTILVEDQLERRMRYMDDDPWWEGRARLNSPGR